MEQRVSDRRIAAESIDRSSLQPAARTSEDLTRQVDAYEQMEAYLAKRETLEDEPAMISEVTETSDSSS